MYIALEMRIPWMGIFSIKLVGHKGVTAPRHKPRAALRMETNFHIRSGLQAGLWSGSCFSQTANLDRTPMANDKKGLVICIRCVLVDARYMTDKTTRAR